MGDMIKNIKDEDSGNIAFSPLEADAYYVSGPKLHIFCSYPLPPPEKGIGHQEWEYEYIYLFTQTISSQLSQVTLKAYTRHYRGRDE
eukprot:15281240-Ditylum_brightwellii.AAC.1